MCVFLLPFVKYSFPVPMQGFCYATIHAGLCEKNSIYGVFGILFLSVHHGNPYPLFAVFFIFKAKYLQV